MFNILDVTSGELVLDAMTQVPECYAAGKAASERAKQLDDQTGHKHQPRKVIEDKAWQVREQERFNDGIYHDVAWAFHEIWLSKVYRPIWEAAEHQIKEFLRVNYYDLIEEHQFKTVRVRKAARSRCQPYINEQEEIARRASGELLFAHVSLDDPTMIAFTKDDLMGSQDRQTRMSPDKFLQRYFGNFLSTDDIAALVVEHENVYLSSASFKLATTPEDIASVYTNYDVDSEAVANSCMREDVDAWAYGNGTHPVHVYGAGDLAVAYLTNADGETTHRALCWPDRKLYSRMYAPNDRLHVLLKRDGFEKSSYYGSQYKSLAGARILKVPTSSGNDCYVMPYLDERVGIRHSGECFVLVDNGINGYSTHETNGTTSSEPVDADKVTCEACEDRTDENIEVHIGTHRISYWCPNCVELDAFFCDATEQYYSCDNYESVEMANGTVWNDDYFRTNGFISQHSSECFPNTERVTVYLDAAREYPAAWAQCEAEDDASVGVDGRWYVSDVIAEALLARIADEEAQLTLTLEGTHS